MAVQPEAVRSHLARILASRQFSGSGRLSDLLSFIVDRSLADDTGGLKETVIAVEIFGRDTSFNANADSIVRNAARRLRQKLDDYYTEAGACETIRIEIPKGGYTPVFREVASPVPRPSQPWRRIAIPLSIAALLLIGLLIARSLYFSGLDARKTITIGSFKSVSDISPALDWLPSGISEMLARDLEAGGVRVLESSADFTVQGFFVRTEAELRIDFRLVDRCGRSVLSLPEVGSESDLLRMVADAGTQIGKVVGGDSFRASVQPQLAKWLPNKIDSIRLYSESAERLRQFDPAAAAALLEQAIAIEPSSALLHLSLSRVSYQLSYEARSRAESRAAFELKDDLPERQKLEVSAWYYQTSKDLARAATLYRVLCQRFSDEPEYIKQLALVLAWDGKVDDALRTLDLALKTNRDPELILVKGRVSTIRGDFAGAAALAHQAFTVAQSMGLRRLEASALRLETGCDLNLHRISAYLESKRSMREICAALGDRGCIAYALRIEGNYALVGQGSFEEARNDYDEALKIVRELGNRVEEGNLLTGLALLEARLNRPEVALAIYARAWDALDGVPLGQKTVDLNRASLELAMCNPKPAEQLYRRALAESRDYGDREGEALSLEGLADIIALQGNVRDARSKFEASAAIFKSTGETADLVRVLAKREAVLVLLEEPAEAGVEQHAVGNAGDLSKFPPWHEAVARRLLAQGDFPGAISEAVAAADGFRKSGDYDHAAESTLVSVRALVKFKRLPEAAQVLARLTNVRDRGTPSMSALVRLESGIVSGELGLQKGDRAAASDLRRFAEQADKLGLRLLSLEARLAHALNRSNVRDLANLRSEARDRGALLLAREAAWPVSKN
jgi:tetratricopeptide (TPR) repeat protein